MSKKDRSPTKTKRLDSSITTAILNRMASKTRLAVVQKLLERAGYRLARIHGSHYIFVKPGAAGVSIPVHKGKVKPVYVRQVEKIIGESSA